MENCIKIIKNSWFIAKFYLINCVCVSEKYPSGGRDSIKKKLTKSREWNENSNQKENFLTPFFFTVFKTKANILSVTYKKRSRVPSSRVGGKQSEQPGRFTKKQKNWTSSFDDGNLMGVFCGFYWVQINLKEITIANQRKQVMNKTYFWNKFTFM